MVGNRAQNYDYRKKHENVSELSSFGKVSDLNLSESTNFSDSLILNERKACELLQLCGFQTNDSWRLIYRGSDHGFGAENFHSKCDGIEKTLTIVKSSDSWIFGGYTSVDWDNKSGYKKDPNAFIFSLVNKTNHPIKLDCHSDYSIFCFSTCGPTFGDGNDLYIANNPNENMSSHSKLSSAYKHPTYEYDSVESQSFLAGSLKFKVEEIEVYSLI